MSTEKQPETLEVEGHKFTFTTTPAGISFPGISIHIKAENGPTPEALQLMTRRLFNWGKENGLRTTYYDGAGGGVTYTAEPTTPLSEFQILHKLKFTLEQSVKKAELNKAMESTPGGISR